MATEIRQTQKVKYCCWRWEDRQERRGRRVRDKELKTD